MYGFSKEASSKVNSDFYAKAVEVFNELPLAAVLNDKVFFVHGGISPDIKTLEDIEKLDRHQETPHKGGMTDLIWSDPDTELAEGFKDNLRGAGKQFSKKATEEFLAANKLDLIVRGNQLVMEGAQYDHDGKVLTVFSAGNYCESGKNKGAVVKINAKLEREIFAYEATGCNVDKVENPNK